MRWRSVRQAEVPPGVARRAHAQERGVQPLHALRDVAHGAQRRLTVQVLG